MGFGYSSPLSVNNKKGVTENKSKCIKSLLVYGSCAPNKHMHTHMGRTLQYTCTRVHVRSRPTVMDDARCDAEHVEEKEEEEMELSPFALKCSSRPPNQNAS